MAGIFRVLFATWLLNVYWIPSDIRGEDNSADDGEAHISDFTPGEKTLIGLLLPYMKSGCEASATRTAIDNAADATMRPDYTSGQVYTIMLVSSFFQAGCPVGNFPFEKLPDTAFAPSNGGEAAIYRLLSSYISSGCDGLTPETASGKDFTPGETEIIKQLSSYFSFQCPGALAAAGGFVVSATTEPTSEHKVNRKPPGVNRKPPGIPPGGDDDDSSQSVGGSDSDGDSDEFHKSRGGKNAAVRSVSLQLVLSILGVGLCLTRIEL